MSKLDALLDESISSESLSRCRLGQYLVDLDEPYKGALSALLGGELSAAVVAYRLKSAGLKGSEHLIYKHRRQICGCPTEVTNE